MTLELKLSIHQDTWKKLENSLDLKKTIAKLVTVIVSNTSNSNNKNTKGTPSQLKDEQIT